MTTDIAADSAPVEQVRRAEPAVAAIELTAIHKNFVRAGGAVVNAIDDISLTVQPAEIVVLLGPSGCGKTTLLRSVAGFEHPDDGVIRVNGTTVYSRADRVNIAPERRPVSMIFQSYALWPHMTVYENVAYPLQCRRTPKSELRERTNSMLERVGLAGLGEQGPGRLSGGQQQRVALARALVAGEGVVLFDEPLSNVDAKVRERLRVELLLMQAELGFAALYVTHDQQEAMELANRIAVLDGGRVLQLDTPRNVYHRPASRFVANFIGKANELRGTVTAVASERRCTVRTQLGELVCRNDGGSFEVGNHASVIWRPEAGVIADDEAAPGWPGRVVAELFSGSHVEYLVEVDGVSCRVLTAVPLSSDSTDVRLYVPDGSAWAVPADRLPDEPGIADGSGT